MFSVREIVNAKYRATRGVGDGLDSRLPDSELFAFIATKALQRIVGYIRNLPGRYVAPTARVYGRYAFRIGRGSVLGPRVLIDARSTQGVHLGSSVTVDAYAVLRASGTLRALGQGIWIGDRTAIGLGNFVHGGGGVKIGRDCLLGPHVRIFSENHNYDRRDTPIREQGETPRPVVIEDDVWIGAGATILAGVTVGHGSVVAAGSVVTKDVKQWSIVAGVPARLIGSRGSEDS